MLGNLTKYFTMVWALSLASLSVICVLFPIALILFLFPIPIRLKILGPIIGVVCKFNLIWGHGTSLLIRDLRPEKSKRFGLYVCNHQSFYDIPLVAVCYQVPPIMKKEVLYIPFAGLVGYSLGSIPFDRSSSNSRKQAMIKAAEQMKEPGIGAMVYPEGTRSKDGRPKIFLHVKTSLIGQAFRQGLPVTPTAVYGTRRLASLNNGLKWGRRLGLKISAPVDPKDFTDENQFIEHCWTQVENNYRELESCIGDGKEKGREKLMTGVK